MKIEQIQTIISEADKGREYWKDLCLKVNLKDNDWIIFLSDDEIINGYLFQHLEQSMITNNLEKVYIIFNTLEEKSYNLNSSNDKIDFVSYEKEKMDCIVTLNNIYQFTDQLIIISSIEGNIQNFQGKKGILLEEIVSIGLLKNKHFQ